MLKLELYTNALERWKTRNRLLNILYVCITVSTMVFPLFGWMSLITMPIYVFLMLNSKNNLKWVRSVTIKAKPDMETYIKS